MAILFALRAASCRVSLVGGLITPTTHGAAMTEHDSEIAGWKYLVEQLHSRLREVEGECRTLRAECEGWRREEAFRRDYETRRMAALTEAARNV